MSFLRLSESPPGNADQADGRDAPPYHVPFGARCQLGCSRVTPVAIAFPLCLAARAVPLCLAARGFSSRMVNTGGRPPDVHDRTVMPLSPVGHDEQHVVDADAQPDHRGQGSVPPWTRLSRPIALPDSDTTPRSLRGQDYRDCPLPESAPSSLLGPGPVWPVAAFAQGFSVK